MQECEAQQAALCQLLSPQPQMLLHNGSKTGESQGLMLCCHSPCHPPSLSSCKGLILLMLPAATGQRQS